MSGEAQLEALLEIINSSARQAIAEYKKECNNVPTINSAELHPLDSSIDNVVLRKVIRLLEGACQQLCASLAPPQRTALNASHFLVSFNATILFVLTSLAGKASQMSWINIQRRRANWHVFSVYWASKGMFKEVDRDVFANNRLSLVIKSTCKAGYFLPTVGSGTSQGASALFDALCDPEYGASHDPGKTALHYAMKQKGMVLSNVFDVLEMNEEKNKKFHRAMAGAGEVLGLLSVLHQYPWDEVSTVCDVGASIGTFSIPLAKAYPHLKITNQDLERVVAQAEDVWKREAPEALEEQRIDFVPLNFFEEAPVAGKDVYYLRVIIHDWPDAEALAILCNVRKAMAPHSRFLIHDYVVGSPNRSSDPAAGNIGIDVAPEPMLPGFGAGNALVYQQDLDMLISNNGKERLLDEWTDLATAAGLRLEKAYDLGDTAVLDFRVA
ncbi:hypothetical protein SCLCIDRAFT_27548 [Scleroderma citrinum Foug A]|uniref:O-methyltransferase C-terminal domain-containing protein n=1 Tax=Scleroderma citrinum Foug A TaxID=1036808 RepID=A0A0C3DSH4_9AGAM|nr:hypothetical protein SCLCIDRAFT_27548 [Scleroderma citrinum Foug A]